MTAKGTQGDFMSLNDFSDKCRICLKNYSDMIDIFDSGVSDKIMEVTNIKISCNDKLPRNMCQDCGTQLMEFHKFLCLAKDSDNYLRTLVNTEEGLDPPVENLCLKSVQGKKRKIHGQLLRLKSSGKSKENLRNEKMYLILVTEAQNNTQNEICIKDLNGEKKNTELTNICKSLIKNCSRDKSFLGDQNSVFQNTPIDLTKENNDKCVHKVNLAVYNCLKCEESFELKEMLIEHSKNYHKTEVLNTSFNYTCPVCLKCDSNKNLFMNHLIDHKKEGFSFFKVDGSGNFTNLTMLEKEIFEVPKLNIRNKIFKFNTYCYICYVCKKVEFINSIHEHLKMCYPNFKECDYKSPHVKYTCPACCESWIDNIEAMNGHLSSHRMDNVFFVKVNNFGQAVDITEEDIAFTEFQKALEFLKFDRLNNSCDKKTKIIKMHDFCICIICDFEADSVSSLCEHYLKIHDQLMPEIKMPCPVCCEHIKFSDLHESVMFLEHLKNHKSEGFVFLRVDKNGCIKRDSNDFGLFSDANDLFNGKVRCPELEFVTEVYVPEVYLDRPAERILCDSEHNEFSSKKDIVNHLKVQVEEVNKSNREYVCEKCGRKCFGRGNYKRHFLTHAEKSEMLSSPKHPTCSICNKTFSNRAALNEHKKHHVTTENDESDTDSGRKICEICGRGLSNNASLAKHRRLHVNNRENALLKCKFCDRRFRRETALNRHVSYHLNPNYFECEVCKLPLPSSASLQRHKLWHQGSSNTYDCKVCKLSFLTKDRLTAHQTHTGHHQDRKRFECNVCHERFFVGREFSQHIKLHPKYKMSECSLCGKRLSTMQSLMLHMSRHFESNSILCPHCGKQFFEERNYHRHLLTHKGVKPFSCDVEGCKKSFYTYFELNRHKKYHNNTRDFSCPYCPKSFHEANHLKVHIRTHTGERPYICPHCNKGFVTRTRCKQHINLIHQGVGCDLIQSNISKKVAVFEALETVS